jgi:hypothetical protein
MSVTRIDKLLELAVVVACGSQAMAVDDLRLRLHALAARMLVRVAPNVVGLIAAANVLKPNGCSRRYLSSYVRSDC